MSSRIDRRPEVSVVVSTYNRCDTLRQALESLLDQDCDKTRYEIVVVDNNSTDGTRQTIESFSRRSRGLRYVFEPRQGLSHARNCGIGTSVAPLIAFTDDDVHVSGDWVSTIAGVFADHPGVGCVGGKVLPTTAEPWPAWLTRTHWAPLALLDYGDSPFQVDGTRRLCLVGANIAFRREVFDKVGMFSPRVQAVGREVGTEDHELLLRFWRTGGHGLYWPELTVMSDVAPERLRRTYHRRWHHRRGRFLARMHEEEMERTRIGRLFGVPAHVYRQATVEGVRCAVGLLRGDMARAFTHEIVLQFCLGYVRARWRESFAESALGARLVRRER